MANCGEWAGFLRESDTNVSMRLRCLRMGFAPLRRGIGDRKKANHVCRLSPDDSTFVLRRALQGLIPRFLSGCYVAPYQNMV